MHMAPVPQTAAKCEKQAATSSSLENEAARIKQPSAGLKGSCPVPTACISTSCNDASSSVPVVNAKDGKARNLEGATKAFVPHCAGAAGGDSRVLPESETFKRSITAAPNCSPCCNFTPTYNRPW